MRFIYTYLFVLLFTCMSMQGLAQVPTPAVEVPESMKPYIPKGYDALNFTVGDLNRDSYPDAIMVLFKIGEEHSSDVEKNTEKRPLLVFVGEADRKYKLVARNNDAVYCCKCGGAMGDPFTGISIKKGYFSIEHYGGSAWRWTRIATFKYSLIDKKWYLYKDGGEGFHASNPEKTTSSSLKTAKDFGKVLFEHYDIYKK